MDPIKVHHPPMKNGVGLSLVWIFRVSVNGLAAYNVRPTIRSISDLSNGLHSLPAGKETPIKHFGLYCSDHIVDVLAWEGPEIRDLGPLAYGVLGAQSIH